MGHDEDKNNFGGGNPTAPVAPNPRATIAGGKRLGMHQSRNISTAQAELDRIAADSNPNKVGPQTDDIVLNNSATKKKDPKVIIAIILAILIVIVFAVGIIVPKVVNKKKVTQVETFDASVLTPIKDDVEKYLSLLQNGDASATYDLSKDVSAWYTVTAVSDSKIPAEEKNQHAIRMISQYDTISSAIKSLGESKTKERLVTMLNKQANSYIVVAEYLKNQSIKDKVIAEFLTNGYDSANNMLTEYNKSAKVLEEDKAHKNTYKTLIAVRELPLKAVNELKLKGCVIQGDVNSDCVSKLKNIPTLGAEYKKLENEYSEKSHELQDTADNYATAFCMSVKNMGNVLRQ